jgi:hypothetical protein
MQILSFQSEIFLKVYTRLVGWTQFRSVALSASGLSPFTGTQHSPRCPYAGIDDVP